ncbi:MAG: hypothetical protein KDB14_06050 [Planctomycetales bacterium]|nr:hypothetical protein [Planctomycetales bacterium]
MSDNGARGFSEVLTADGTWQIVVPRFRWTYLAQLLGGLLGAGFIAFMITMVVTHEGATDPLAWPVMSGFGLFFLGIGYSGIAGMVNRLHIEVDRWELRVWQSPLPHWQRCRLPLDEIQYVRRMTVRGSSGSHRTGSTVTYTARLAVVLADDEQRTIFDTDQSDTKRIDEIAAWLSEKAEVPLVAAGGEAPLQAQLGKIDKAVGRKDRKTPRGIQLGQTGVGSVVGVRWFRMQHIATLIGCIALSLPVGIFWLIGAGLARVSTVALLGLFIPGVFSILIAVTAYGQVAGFFNRTWFFVANGALHRVHRPLPWPGNCSIDRKDIKSITTTHQSITDALDTNTARCFSVVCHRRDGREITLASKLTSSQATFLAAQINEQLDL